MTKFLNLPTAASRALQSGGPEKECGSGGTGALRGTDSALQRQAGGERMPQHHALLLPRQPIWGPGAPAEGLLGAPAWMDAQGAPSWLGPAGHSSHFSAAHSFFRSN